MKSTLGVRRNRIPAADTHDISSRVTKFTGVARMPGLIAPGSSAISRPGKRQCPLDWPDRASGLDASPDDRRAKRPLHSQRRRLRQ